MKVAVFGTALFAFAIPAFGKIETSLQPLPPVMPRNCEAALSTSRVPSAVVVLTLPPPPLPSGDVIGSAQSLGTRSSIARTPAGRFARPSSRSAVVVPGVGTVSGIGGIQRSGIGSIGTGGIGSIGTGGIGSIGVGGIGSMGTSGIGSIGMGGIGSVGTSSLGIPPSPTSPFTAPTIQSPGSSSTRSNALAHPLPGTPRRLPFFCP